MNRSHLVAIAFVVLGGATAHGAKYGAAAAIVQRKAETRRMAQAEEAAKLKAQATSRKTMYPRLDAVFKQPHVEQLKRALEAGGGEIALGTLGKSGVMGRWQILVLTGKGPEIRLVGIGMKDGRDWVEAKSFRRPLVFRERGVVREAENHGFVTPGEVETALADAAKRLPEVERSRELPKEWAPGVSAKKFALKSNAQAEADWHREFEENRKADKARREAEDALFRVAP
jgi:hypothetical protein